MDKNSWLYKFWKYRDMDGTPRKITPTIDFYDEFKEGEIKMNKPLEELDELVKKGWLKSYSLVDVNATD